MKKHVQPDANFSWRIRPVLIFEHKTAYGSRVRGLVTIQHSVDSMSRVYELEGRGEGLYSIAFNTLFQLSIQLRSA